MPLFSRSHIDRVFLGLLALCLTHLTPSVMANQEDEEAAECERHLYPPQILGLNEAFVRNIFSEEQIEIISTEISEYQRHLKTLAFEDLIKKLAAQTYERSFQNIDETTPASLSPQQFLALHYLFLKNSNTATSKLGSTYALLRNLLQSEQLSPYILNVMSSSKRMGGFSDEAINRATEHLAAAASIINLTLELYEEVPGLEEAIKKRLKDQDLLQLEEYPKELRTHLENLSLESLNFELGEDNAGINKLLPAPLVRTVYGLLYSEEIGNHQFEMLYLIEAYLDSPLVENRQLARNILSIAFPKRASALEAKALEESELLAQIKALPSFAATLTEESENVPDSLYKTHPFLSHVISKFNPYLHRIEREQAITLLLEKGYFETALLFFKAYDLVFLLQQPLELSSLKFRSALSSLNYYASERINYYIRNAKEPDGSSPKVDHIVLLLESTSSLYSWLNMDSLIFLKHEQVKHFYEAGVSAPELLQALEFFGMGIAGDHEL